MRWRALVAVFVFLFVPQLARAAAFAVASTVDSHDVAPGDGICLDAASVCSLRAAIEEANALPGADTVSLDATKYLIRLGSIDVTDDMTLTGSGEMLSIVRGNRKTRIFHVTATATVTMSGITIERGRAESGAAILNDGALQLNHVTLRTNTATQTYGGLGGAIYNNGIVDLTEVDLHSNRATGRFGGFGGSLYNNGTATVTDSVIRRSRATGCGGGVFNNSGSIVLLRTTIERNRVTNSGGGLFQQDGEMTLTNAVVARNRATAIGGGIFTYASLHLTNVTLSKNRSGTGGGLFSRMPISVDLNNVTITLNRAREGAGIFNDGLLTLRNTIIAKNAPRDCEGSPLTSSGHNLTGVTCGLSAMGDVSTTDPKLGPLDDNGGGMETHALMPDSPAIDAGDEATCAADDERGQPRPTDGDGNGTATCDIGAYELVP